MTAFPEANEATSEQLFARSSGVAAAANERTFHFMCGAQKMLLNEMIFAGSEMFERAVTETRLLTEFVSKGNGETDHSALLLHLEQMNARQGGKQ